MSSTFDQNGPWDRVAAELRACKDSQKQAYGDVDNATLGRYLAGDLDPTEMASLEQSLDELPELRKLAELVQDVLRDLEPIEAAPPEVPVAPAPVILPLAEVKPRRRRWDLRRYGSLAAACLIFACLAVLPATRRSALRSGDLSLDTATASLPGKEFGAGPPDLMVWLEAPPRDEGAGGFVAGGNGGGLGSLVPHLVPIEIPEPVPDTAEQISRTVVKYHGEGDATAERTLRHNYFVCKQKHGPDHETTRYAERQLAGVYQYALNEATTAPVAVAEPMPVTLKKCPQARARDTGRQVRELIVRRSAPKVEAEVVPVLNEALKQARTKPERLALIRALGELGPAAKPESVHLLCERLKKSDDEERLAVLDALDRMGSAARPAVPALTMLAKAAPSLKMVSVSDKKDAEVRGGKPTPPERARQVLRGLEGSESRVGVFDRAGLFSLERSMEVSRALRKLARESHLAVRVETLQAQQTAPTTEPACVRVVISSDGVVRVVAKPTLCAQGFDAQALEKRLAGCQGDRALDAVLAAVQRPKK